jgi:hypothetical protein
MIMGSRRQAMLRLVVGLAVAVLVGCAASTTATPAGTPDVGTDTVGTDGTATGDWKDLLTDEPGTGDTGDWKDRLACDEATPSTSAARTC